MAELLAPLPADAWTLDAAAHLWRRAGFGAPRDQAARLHAMGLEQAVSSILRGAQLPPPAAPECVRPLPDPRERRRVFAGMPPEERRRYILEQAQAERRAVRELQAWWMTRLAGGGHPLQEKLTLFWHGHFATSARKVRSSQHNWALNNLFRQHAAGNLKALTLAVGQSPAMLHYLDNRTSTREHPNENWARELMELFTLGPGAYTEDDIKEAARAFTGWTVRNGAFEYNEQAHDFDEKRFMGRRGNFDGWDIINILFEQPAAATFVTAKLWRFFAYDDPEPEVVQGLARTLRTSRFELAPMLARLFTSRAFYSERARLTQVKSPVQHMVQLTHDLGLQNPPADAMVRIAGVLGQRLFYPPNVKGWDGNREWINANALLARYNAPLALMAAARGAGNGGGAWKAAGTLRALPNDSAAAWVDALVRHYTGRPPHPAQRRELLRALGIPDADAPLAQGRLDRADLVATLHLLYSMAEYQLC